MAKYSSTLEPAISGTLKMRDWKMREKVWKAKREIDSIAFTFAESAMSRIHRTSVRMS